VRGAEFRATIEDVERDGFGKSPLYESWLTEVDGVPLGLATFFLCYSTFNGKPSLLLDNLFVQESARGVKIGEKLVTKIGCRALELNCCRIELLVEKKILPVPFMRNSDSLKLLTVFTVSQVKS